MCVCVCVCVCGVCVCGVCVCGVFVCALQPLALALSPGPAQILSRSRGEKLGEGLESKLRHGPEMVDSVSTN